MSPPGWLLAVPVEILLMGSWWVTLWGIFRVCCWCPFPEALTYPGLPLFCCMVETKSPGHWGRTRCEHQSLEPFHFESLEPLSIFSSSAISRLSGLFQLLGEEVSGRAQPDDIYFHGSREPPHALCSLLALQCPVAEGGAGDSQQG